MQKQKDFLSITKKLFKSQDKLLLVPVPNHKSWTLNEISKITILDKENIVEFENLNLALRYLEDLDKWPDCNPVLTGSIFLVSAFLSELS